MHRCINNKMCPSSWQRILSETAKLIVAPTPDIHAVPISRMQDQRYITKTDWEASRTYVTTTSRMAKWIRISNSLSQRARQVMRLKSICRAKLLNCSARIFQGLTKSRWFKPIINTGLSFMLRNTRSLQKNGLVVKLSVRKRITKNIRKSLVNTTSLTKRAVSIENARPAAPKLVPH